MKDGEIIGPHANFRNVPMAMLTLFGYATGDAVTLAVGETVILLHPPLHLVRVTIRMKRGVSKMKVPPTAR